MPRQLETPPPQKRDTRASLDPGVIGNCGYGALIDALARTGAIERHQELSERMAMCSRYCR